MRYDAHSFEYNAKKDIKPMNSSSIWTKLYFRVTDVKNLILSTLLEIKKDYLQYLYSLELMSLIIMML